MNECIEGKYAMPNYADIYIRHYFRFLPFLPDGFECVEGIGGVAGAIEVSTLALEDGMTPLGFEDMGLGLFSNAAKEEGVP